MDEFNLVRYNHIILCHCANKCKSVNVTINFYRKRHTHIYIYTYTDIDPFDQHLIASNIDFETAAVRYSLNNRPNFNKMIAMLFSSS